MRRLQENLMRRIFFLIAVLLAAPGIAASLYNSDWSKFESDFEENTKTWQEIQAQLPPAPKPENLVEVKLDSSTRNKLLIDATSLSSGDDGVVRYTAIIRSPTGAENISFEGMRCENGERKLYAFGRPNGDWSRNRYAKWEPIQARLAGGYHRELFFHYLCTVNTNRDLPTLLRLLKSGGIYEQ
jgi:hypothetical protein